MPRQGTPIREKSKKYNRRAKNTSQSSKTKHSKQNLNFHTRKSNGYPYPYHDKLWNRGKRLAKKKCKQDVERAVDSMKQLEIGFEDVNEHSLKHHSRKIMDIVEDISSTGKMNDNQYLQIMNTLFKIHKSAETPYRFPLQNPNIFTTRYETLGRRGERLNGAGGYSIQEALAYSYGIDVN